LHGLSLFLFFAHLFFDRKKLSLQASSSSSSSPLHHSHQHNHQQQHLHQQQQRTTLHPELDPTSDEFRMFCFKVNGAEERKRESGHAERKKRKKKVSTLTLEQFALSFSFFDLT